jgi:hypothetical protein
LRLDDGGGRLPLTAHAGPDLVAALIVNPEPGAILAPGAEGLINRLPMRQIVRHEAPGTAATQDVLDAIDHLASRVFAGSTASLFGRQEGGQDLPLLLSQVRRVSQALA